MTTISDSINKVSLSGERYGRESTLADLLIEALESGNPEVITFARRFYNKYGEKYER